MKTMRLLADRGREGDRFSPATGRRSRIGRLTAKTDRPRPDGEKDGVRVPARPSSIGYSDSPRFCRLAGLAELDGLGGSIQVLTFPTGGTDGNVRLWDVDPALTGTR